MHRGPIRWPVRRTGFWNVRSLFGGYMNIMFGMAGLSSIPALSFGF
jgi:hypothetical protein